MSPGFGPAVLTCVICPVPRHRPCTPDAQSCRHQPGAPLGLSPPPPPPALPSFILSGLVQVMSLALPSWPLPPSRALSTVTSFFFLQCL